MSLSFAERGRDSGSGLKWRWLRRGAAAGLTFRHGRACPGHPRSWHCSARRTWMAGTSSAKTRFALLPGHVGNEHFGCVADSDITAILCREPVIFRIAAAGQISDPCVRHGPRQAEPEPTPFLEANGKA